MQKRSNGLITSSARTNQYPNKMIKDTKPFLLADIYLHPAEGKFWYQDPPQRRMGAHSLSLSPPLILNEGFFLVFLCCWWGVSGSRKNGDFLGRAFKCRGWGVAPSLSLLQLFSVSLAHLKWGQAPSQDPLLSKTPKSSSPPPALSSPPPTTFSSPPSFTSPACHIFLSPSLSCSHLLHMCLPTASICTWLSLQYLSFSALHCRSILKQQEGKISADFMICRSKRNLKAQLNLVETLTFLSSGLHLHNSIYSRDFMSNCS